MRDLTIDTPFVYSWDCIASFFGGDVECIDAFNKVCENMLSLDSELVIRHNSSIIGMAKGHEYYRFYVSCYDGEYFIKYKHLKEKEIFSPLNVGKYFVRNIESCEFFSKMGEEVLHRYARKKDSTFALSKELVSDDEWEMVRDRFKDSSSILDQKASDFEVNKFYLEIVEIFNSAAEEFLKPRERVVFVKRILDNAPLSLRDMGQGFNVSGERVRQIQNNAWRKLSNGIYLNVKFNVYREKLINVLLSIPIEMFCSVIHQMVFRNKYIGEWLSAVVNS